ILTGLLCASCVLMISTVPELYKADNFFSMVFFEVIPKSPDAIATARELGLDKTHLVAKGMYAFESRWPASDIGWKIATYRRSGYNALLLYYLHHPLRTWRIMAASMREYCRDIRPVVLANYRKQDGFPLGSRTQSFSVWSNLLHSAYEWS